MVCSKESRGHFLFSDHEVCIVCMVDCLNSKYVRELVVGRGKELRVSGSV